MGKSTDTKPMQTKRKRNKARRNISLDMCIFGYLYIHLYICLLYVWPEHRRVLLEFIYVLYSEICMYRPINYLVSQCQRFFVTEKIICFINTVRGKWQNVYVFTETSRLIKWVRLWFLVVRQDRNGSPDTVMHFTSPGDNLDNLMYKCLGREILSPILIHAEIRTVASVHLSYKLFYCIRSFICRRGYEWVGVVVNWGRPQRTPTWG